MYVCVHTPAGKRLIIRKRVILPNTLYTCDPGRKTPLRITTRLTRKPAMPEAANTCTIRETAGPMGRTGVIRRPRTPL
jgi:hypothetical protein